MIWHRHKNLSENDLKLLAGTPLIEALLSCRLVVVYDPNESQPSMETLGLFDTKGMVHVRKLDQSGAGSSTLEFLFQFEEDRIRLEEHLTHVKISR